MGRRLMALALVAGAVAGCATGRGRVVDAGPAPTRPPEPGADAAAPTPALPGAGAAEATTTVSLWLTRGESLQVVKRAVPKVARIGAEAVKALLAGPTADEAKGGVATAIPPGTRFLGLVVDAGVARVDLSRQFDAGGGGLGLTLRLAQVACTLGEFPSVRGVRFAIDGQLVSVLSGDGAVVDTPVTCESYRRRIAR
jgi:spore germination protein GerM